MTEQEWLAAEDPITLMYHKSGRSDRKRRLLACACVRRVLHHLSDERFAQAVAVAERHADGRANLDELKQARRLTKAADDEMTRGKYPESMEAAAHAVEALLAKATTDCLMALEHAAHARAAEGPRRQWDRALAREEAAQLALTREVFANPFRPVGVAPAWLSHGGGAARKLAEAIDAGRAFERLPVLADALEEAGCDSADLLAHLRGPGPHVLGCWGLDLVLGKG